MRVYKEWKALIGIFIRVLCFIILFAIIFGVLQCIFVPKRFPYSNYYEYGKLKYFNNESKNSIDILICGTSHAGRGILPMELYESYGLKSYNLATSSQGLDITYYLLKEALKTQTPKLLVMDVSSLYLGHQEPITWKLMTDEMPFSMNKISAVQEYLRCYPDTKETVNDVIFPLLGYHTRWKDLSNRDFESFKSNKHYFGKGGNLISFIVGGVSIDEMNTASEELLQNTEKIMYEYNNGVFNEWNEKNIIYSTNILQENIDWLIKIKKLCDENNINFVAIKVPSVVLPQSYNSAWTKAKYQEVYNLCTKYGIDYYDLLYDVDLGLDVSTDSQDGGRHLNLRGALKVSAAIGNYIMEHYEISGVHNVQWDRDLDSYQKVRKVALLELEQDFDTYINMLVKECQDKMIFVVASDDMFQGLNNADIDALRKLGLQMGFTNAKRESYIAVINNGAVTYEALSNRVLRYGETFNGGMRYDLYSSGWWTNPGCSIVINGTGYAVGSRGMNIVVYDDERDLVWDSVCFDTSVEYHIPIRINGMINGFEEALERYIMDVEDK